jgi:hypothetical protein
MGLIEQQGEGFDVVASMRGRAYDQIDQVLFAFTLERSLPPWLADADSLIPDVAGLPQDATHLAALLDVPEPLAWATVQQIQGHLDLAARARVGAAGELALIAALEREWPSSTDHTSLTNDGFGYDIVLNLGETRWHLEIKTTTRRGRLVIHLSRHEYDVGLVDPTWRMVVVGLDEIDEARGVATVDAATIRERAPRDVAAATSWASARYELLPTDLSPGLSFLMPGCLLDRHSVLSTANDASGHFSWMPSPQRAASAG